MDPTPELGERLAAQGQALRLLVEHLAGRAIRARIEPDDLVQEVFLRALGSPADMPAEEPGEAPLRRYLARIARHAVVDAARALRAAKRDGRELPLARSEWSRAGVRESRLPGAEPGPATRVASAESVLRLVETYRGLAPDHRRVIGLRQFEGLTAAQAARRMGRSEAAVHSLYRRALLAWEEAAG